MTLSDILATLFSALLVLVTTLLWCANRKMIQIQRGSQDLQRDFNNWTKGQRKPFPVIVQGTLKFFVKGPPRLTIELCMSNPGEATIFFQRISLKEGLETGKEIPLEECPIREFLQKVSFPLDAFEDQVRPREIKSITIRDIPLKKEPKELENFIKENKEQPFSLTESYVSGEPPPMRLNTTPRVNWRRTDRDEQPWEGRVTSCHTQDAL